MLESSVAGELIPGNCSFLTEFSFISSSLTLYTTKSYKNDDQNDQINLQCDVELICAGIKVVTLKFLLQLSIALDQ